MTVCTVCSCRESDFDTVQHYRDTTIASIVTRFYTVFNIWSEADRESDFDTVQHYRDTTIASIVTRFYTVFNI